MLLYLTKPLVKITAIQSRNTFKSIDFSSPYINCNSLGGVSNLELAFIDDGILQNCIDYFTIDWETYSRIMGRQ